MACYSIGCARVGYLVMYYRVQADSCNDSAIEIIDIVPNTRLSPPLVMNVDIDYTSDDYENNYHASMVGFYIKGKMVKYDDDQRLSFDFSPLRNLELPGVSSIEKFMDIYHLVNQNKTAIYRYYPQFVDEFNKFMRKLFVDIL